VIDFTYAERPRKDNRGRFFVCARQGALTWRCKSSADPTGGTASRTARAAIVRWGLKEAAGKTLARRTGIAYEAVVLGEET
jgi:hypothetical protein